MPLSTDFHDRVLGLLLPFSGYGLYLDGLMFSLIANDPNYFKIDDEYRDNYIKAGTSPFTYGDKRRPVEMSYYRIPKSLMDNPVTLAKWEERAHQNAKRACVKYPPRRRRGNTRNMPHRNP